MTKHSEKKHNNKDVSRISLILPNKMLAILTEEAREMAAADGHNPNDEVGMMNYVSQIVANIFETTYNNDFNTTVKDLKALLTQYSDDTKVAYVTGNIGFSEPSISQGE